MSSGSCLWLSAFKILYFSGELCEVKLSDCIDNDRIGLSVKLRLPILIRYMDFWLTKEASGG